MSKRKEISNLIKNSIEFTNFKNYFLYFLICFLYYFYYYFNYFLHTDYLILNIHLQVLKPHFLLGFLYIYKIFNII